MPYGNRNGARPDNSCVPAVLARGAAKAGLGSGQSRPAAGRSGPACGTPRRRAVLNRPRRRWGRSARAAPNQAARRRAATHGSAACFGLFSPPSFTRSRGRIPEREGMRVGRTGVQARLGGREERQLSAPPGRGERTPWKWAHRAPNSPPSPHLRDAVQRLVLEELGRVVVARGVPQAPAGEAHRLALLLADAHLHDELVPVVPHVLHLLLDDVGQLLGHLGSEVRAPAEEEEGRGVRRDRVRLKLRKEGECLPLTKSPSLSFGGLP